MVKWLASRHGRRRLLGQSWCYSAQHAFQQHASSDTSSTASSTITHASLSSSTERNTTTTAESDRRRPSNLHGMRAVFPWRHEPDPLPRFVSNQTDLGGRTGVPPLGLLPPPYQGWAVNLVTWLVANGGLGLSWYHVFGKAWKDELANSAAFAFSQSVSAVLSNTYHVPWNNGADEDDELVVNFDSGNTKNQLDDDEKDDDHLNLGHMLDERLVRFYRAAHEYGRDEIHVQLRMKPVVAHLDNLFAVPFLTRAEVVKDPSLQQKIPDLLVATEGGDGTNTAQSFTNLVRFVNEKSKEMMMEQMERRGEPIISSTIIAQVLVGCEEAFSVRDLYTNSLTQGNADGQTRPVVHVVRLEMEVEYNLETKSWQRGHWVITDWDDMLDGNVWFL